MRIKRGVTMETKDSSDRGSNKGSKGKMDSMRVIYIIIFPFIAAYFRENLQSMAGQTFESIKKDLAEFILKKLVETLESIPDDQAVAAADYIFESYIKPYFISAESEDRNFMPLHKHKIIEPKKTTLSQKILKHTAELAKYIEGVGIGVVVDAATQTVITNLSDTKNLSETEQQMVRLPVFAVSSLVVTGIVEKLKSILPISLPSEYLMGLYLDSVKVEPRLKLQLRQLYEKLLEKDLPYALADVISSMGQVSSKGAKPGEMKKFMESVIKLTALQDEIRTKSQELQEKFTQLGQKGEAQKIEHRVAQTLQRAQDNIETQGKKKPGPTDKPQLS